MDAVLAGGSGRRMGAVLAGGSGRRMGADKAFIEMEGTPMVARAAAALHAAGVSDVIVVGGDTARVDALGLHGVPDRYPGQGPLGGIITALHALAGPGADAVVTLPCDVIEPAAAAVRAVLERLDGTVVGAVLERLDGAVVGTEPGWGLEESSAPDAVVPIGAGVPQWLHAAWRSRCRPLLEAKFALGVRGPRDAVSGLGAVMFELAGTRWFRDADTPADLPATARIPSGRALPEPTSRSTASPTRPQPAT